MTNPMKNPTPFDDFVLLDGAKRWPVPGVSAVTVNMAANLDTQATPGAGTQQTQLNEATCEIEVKVVMWTPEQYQAYLSLLAYLRRGTKTGPAVFTSAHPEVVARKVKRLYFESEQPTPYNPKDGYRVTLKFKEKLKDKTNTQAVDDGAVDSALGVGGISATAPNNAAEAAVADSARRTTFQPPAPADGGRATTATPGYCSASARVSGVAAGMNPKLFGGSANSTKALFRQAGMLQAWRADSLRNLRPGQFVFFDEPAGFGHVGIVTGFDQDGMPLVTGNNYVTYADKGGSFDRQGHPLNTNIDARGTVRLNRLGTPTAVGFPGGVPSGPVVQGPAAPLPPPSYAPSRNVVGPKL